MEYREGRITLTKRGNRQKGDTKLERGREEKTE